MDDVAVAQWYTLCLTAENICVQIPSIVWPVKRYVGREKRTSKIVEKESFQQIGQKGERERKRGREHV